MVAMCRALRWLRPVWVALGVSGLAACSVANAVNPVSWYHDLAGTESASGPNQKNLAEGNKEPYPNLADVPAPPDRAMTAADRRKLENSLVADRENAKYTDQKLDAGQPVPGEVIPPAPPPAPAPAASAKPATAPSAKAGAVHAAAAKPAASSAAPAKAASATAMPGKSAAAAGAATAPPVPARAALPKRGSESPPQESSLTSPTISNLPKGEMPPPPPPSPSVASTAPPPSSPLPKAPAVAAPPPPPVTPAPPRQVAAAGQGLPRPPSVSYEVGEVKFTSGSAVLGAPQRSTLADIVTLHKRNGGRIRVVGYAERPAGGSAAAEINTFTLALERAKRVAEALTQAGIPADQIAVEAAPSRPGVSEIPRVEVYFEQ